MKTRSFGLIFPHLAALLALLVCHTALANRTPTFTVSPTTVSNTYSGTVTLQISGLGTGETVVVQKYADLNTNGIIDAGDQLVAQFSLTDNVAQVIQSVTNINVPGDWNPTNGVITAPLNDFQGSFAAFAAKYAFVLSSPTNDFTPLTNFFTVTNFAYSQSITGVVKSGGTPVPNAFVFTLTYNGSKEKGLATGTVANNSGNFTLPVPVGTYLLTGGKSNYVASFSSPILTVGAGVTTNVNLTFIAATNRISGKLFDTNTPSIVLPGVPIPIQSTDNFLAICYTDTNGNFSAPVNASTWQINPQGPDLALHGYVEYNNSTKVPVTSGTVTTNIAFSAATALVYGTIKDNYGNPLPGVPLDGEDDQGSGNNNSLYNPQTTANQNGIYVMGVAPAPSWDVEVNSGDGKDPQYANYIFSLAVWNGNAGGPGGTNVSAGVAIPQNFTGVLATNQITGHLKDSSGNPISGIQVGANGNDTNGVAYSTQATTDSNGYYVVPVAPGIMWNMYVNCGCTNCSGSLSPNSYQCPNSQYIVTTSGNNPTNDFIVQPSGSGPYQINGQVQDNNLNPVPGINVYGSDNNGNHFTTTTDGNGNYQLNNVGNGSVTVSLDCGQLTAAGYSCASSQVAPISNGNYNGLNFSVNICGTLTVTTTSPIPDGFVNQNYNLQLANTGCNSPFTWTLTPGSHPLPGNLGLSSAGLLSGKPAALGTTNFSVRVKDGLGNTADQLLQLSVYNPIVVTNSVLPGGTASDYYSYQLGATGGLPPYNWTLASGPAWLSLSASGLLSGTPASNSNYAITVALTDQDGNPAQTNLSIPVGCSTLQITTTTLPDGEVGNAYYYNNSSGFTVQNQGCNAPFTWSMSPGSLPLPAGLNLSSGGVISGMPTTPGTNYFSLRVTDNTASYVDQLLSIIVYPTLVITNNSPLPNATINTAYNIQLGSSGGIGSGNGFGWQLNTGTMPPGVNINLGGDILGTPTALGTYSFSVGMIDNASYGAQKSFSITVLAQSLQITTASLSNAQMGVNYTNQLQASGGTAPYTWTIANGSQPLPPNLMLSTNGIISGVPATNGTFSFIVRVTDTNSLTTTRSLTLTVNPRPVLSLPAWVSGRFQFLITGATGQYYTVQTSTNLKSPANWVSLFVTNSATTNSFIVVDPNATNKQSFYRLLIVP